MAEYDSRSNDASTAPTTPDGSLTFSPVLQATQLIDAFELGPSVVRNICCIGAGYVGMWLSYRVGVCGLVLFIIHSKQVTRGRPERRRWCSVPAVRDMIAFSSELLPPTASGVMRGIKELGSYCRCADFVSQHFRRSVCCSSSQA